MKRIALMIVLFTWMTALVLGATPKDIKDVSVTDIQHELMYTSNNAGKNKDGSGAIRVAWYIPPEFWKATLSQNKAVTPAAAKAMTDGMEGIAILAVVRARVLLGGKFEFYPEADVVTSVTAEYTDKDGKKIPLEMEEDLSPQVTAVVASMKPMLKAAMGNLGQNMDFIVYRDHDAKGHRLVPLDKEGKLTVTLDKLPGDDGAKAEFLLPLNALFEPRSCPKCHHGEMDIRWHFCPYCGTKLGE